MRVIPKVSSSTRSGCGPSAPSGGFDPGACPVSRWRWPTSLAHWGSTTRRSVAEPGLVVRSLSVRFGGIIALESVDLDVSPGEIVGLIGPNGAGKSSLVNCVGGQLV